MRLLNTKEVRTIGDRERDAENRLLKERRIVILEEIKKFNHQRDVLIQSKELLEKDFDQFCEDINNKRRVLQAEIKELEDKLK